MDITKAQAISVVIAIAISVYIVWWVSGDRHI